MKRTHLESRRFEAPLPRSEQVTLGHTKCIRRGEQVTLGHPKCIHRGEQVTLGHPKCLRHIGEEASGHPKCLRHIGEEASGHPKCLRHIGEEASDHPKCLRHIGEEASTAPRKPRIREARRTGPSSFPASLHCSSSKYEVDLGWHPLKDYYDLVGSVIFLQEGGYSAPLLCEPF